MSDNNDKNDQKNEHPSKKMPLREGYQPGQKGYHPGGSNLNPEKPPQGGSGVPPKGDGGKGGKKE